MSGYRRRLALSAAALLIAAGCRKTQRELRTPAPASALPREVARTELLPAGGSPAGGQPMRLSRQNPYEGNSYAISEGQRLFDWYNCTGCHARGGGGSGPALMDDKWLYGGTPPAIFRTIVQGAPNGMPAWGGRIPEQQVWQLVAYIESMDADKKLADPPGPRQDHLQAGEGLVSR
jgi:cytochrome c oxidase cbb3-type subunit III